MLLLGVQGCWTAHGVVFGGGSGEVVVEDKLMSFWKFLFVTFEKCEQSKKWGKFLRFPRRQIHQITRKCLNTQNPGKVPKLSKLGGQMTPLPPPTPTRLGTSIHLEKIECKLDHA